MQPQPSPLSSFLPFFGHGQTWAIAEKKMLTGNKIFCCLQAYKLISGQCWCLLKNNQKKPYSKATNDQLPAQYVPVMGKAKVHVKHVIQFPNQRIETNV